MSKDHGLFNDDHCKSGIFLSHFKDSAKGLYNLGFQSSFISSTCHSVPFKFMHIFIHEMKDADFWSIPCGNAAACQMLSYSHVAKDLNRNEQLNLNIE